MNVSSADQRDDDGGEGPVERVAARGEWWCPDCIERVAVDYMEMAAQCGQRGRGTWLCPDCAADLVDVDEPVRHCPLCGEDVTGSRPISERAYRIRCPDHGLRDVGVRSP